MKWDGSEASVHPMYDYRKVSTQKLKQRLDVLIFKDEGSLVEFNYHPVKVRIPLNQHIGVPSIPIVVEGDKVKKYDLIAKSGDKISSSAHASIDGFVYKILKDEILLTREL